MVDWGPAGPATVAMSCDVQEIDGYEPRSLLLVFLLGLPSRFVLLILCCQVNNQVAMLVVTSRKQPIRLSLTGQVELAGENVVSVSEARHVSVLRYLSALLTAALASVTLTLVRVESTTAGHTAHKNVTQKSRNLCVSHCTRLEPTRSVGHHRIQGSASIFKSVPTRLLVRVAASQPSISVQRTSTRSLTR